tara:strand:- start:530 stop:2569 length:2040 start_codon:yes stop_codon:yes gene_type:complete
MNKRSLSINFPLERAVLSDFLPFEVPITFSNRHFYRFIVDIKLKFSDEVFSWLNLNYQTNNIVLMLLGLPFDTQLSEIVKGKRKYVTTEKITKAMEITKPFSFSINHKKDEFRYLSLIHPKSQLLAVSFYNEFKELLTYYSGISEFTMRAPHRVAGCTFVDSRSLIETFDKETSIEIDGQNYENLRSFFVYRRFKNIHEFYESEEHHWCERHFSHLHKLDIAQCFDSIYTHSIAWAVYKRDYVKKYLKETQKTFPAKFDRLMQAMNHNETNGIVIGPELSRIFAEIILQDIDSTIQESLKINGLIVKKDYQIFRYVDDYFIFCNERHIFDEIKKVIQVSLKEFKLTLNKHKEEVYERPIITPISIAKKKIAKLISDTIDYKLEDKKEGEEYRKGTIHITESSLKTDFKSIISSSQITYSDILNYSMAIVERKVKNVLKESKLVKPSQSSEKQLVRSLFSIINFVYFIYSVAPKVNGTIKLCRIIQQIILFLNDNNLDSGYRHIIFKVIFDNTYSVLEQCSVSKETSIETLYLLVLIRQLGKFYWLDEELLFKYFNVVEKDEILVFKEPLNHFSITALIFYISDKVRYAKIRSLILDHVIDLYEVRKETILEESELIHLSLDLIACPYLANSFKKKILGYYNVPNERKQLVINASDCWFTKWTDFDFTKELDAKLSFEVY